MVENQTFILVSREAEPAYAISLRWLAQVNQNHMASNSNKILSLSGRQKSILLLSWLLISAAAPAQRSLLFP
jgi:hypothetical protein